MVKFEVCSEVILHVMVVTWLNRQPLTPQGNASVIGCLLYSRDHMVKNTLCIEPIRLSMNENREWVLRFK